jgi:hypothetical protein
VQESAASSELEPATPAKPPPKPKPAFIAAVNNAIDQEKEWLLESGHSENEKRERIERLAGGTVPRDELRVALKNRVPDLNRGPGRPRKKK